MRIFMGLPTSDELGQLCGRLSVHGPQNFAVMSGVEETPATLVLHGARVPSDPNEAATAEDERSNRAGDPPHHVVLEVHNLAYGTEGGIFFLDYCPGVEHRVGMEVQVSTETPTS